MSPRTQSQIISLYDTAIQTVSLSLSLWYVTSGWSGETSTRTKLKRLDLRKRDTSSSIRLPKCFPFSCSATDLKKTVGEFVYTYICTCTCMFICIYVCLYMFMHMYMCMYVYMYTTPSVPPVLVQRYRLGKHSPWIHVCICKCTFTCIFICKYIYMYVYVYAHVYVYVCMYTTPKVLLVLVQRYRLWQNCR